MPISRTPSRTGLVIHRTPVQAPVPQPRRRSRQTVATEDAIADGVTHNPNCARCELHNGVASVCIQGTGETSPEVLFLGEAPGHDEDERGEPFVGQAGQMLRTIIADTLPGVSVGFTNVCRCRPPGNRAPKQGEVKACQGYLHNELLHRSPRLIVSLGNTPLKLITGRTGITSSHGQVSTYRAGGVDFPVLFTYHPSAINYNPDVLEPLVEDLRKAAGLVLEARNTGRLSNERRRYDSKYRYVADINELPQVYERIRLARWFTYDIETPRLLGIGHNRSELLPLCIAFGFLDNESICVPLWHPQSPFNRPDINLIEWLRQVFELSNRKVGHNNIQFDSRYLWAVLDIPMPPVELLDDTMLMHYCTNELPGTHGLKQLAWRFTDMGGYDNELVRYCELHRDADPSKGGSYSNVPLDMLMKYCCADSDVTAQIAQVLTPEVDAEYGFLYYHILKPNAMLLGQVTYNGLPVDLQTLEYLVHAYPAALARAEQQLRAFPEVVSHERETGKSINFASPAQVANLLYDKLGFPVRERTGTGAPSADEEALTQMAATGHPIPKLLLEHRKLSSLHNRYVKGVVQKNLIADDGAIHASFLVHGTVTGRLSAVPNVQNLPREGFLEKLTDARAVQIQGVLGAPEVKKISYLGHIGFDRYLIDENRDVWSELSVKDMFAAPEGWSIIGIDYSQLELRVAAMFSQDPHMLEIFVQGGDIHSGTAVRMFKKSADQITKEERVAAKQINFGLIYGKGVQSLAVDLNVTVEQAQAFLSRYFAEFRVLKQYLDRCRAFARANLHVTTIFGRKRRLPGANSGDHRVQAEAMRQAVNMPVQGTAADIAMLGMCTVQNFIDSNGLADCAKTILNVHDAGYHLVRDEILDDITPIFVNLYEHPTWPPLDDETLRILQSVPLVADAEVGKRLGTLREFTRAAA